ncbi:hypothetical protein EVG20_g5833 [Dentipellis fragilis]|uniref:Uncharacterized protein n=1 Tax=Dentipellis fragilis TaxID=205917 RepID=A0A4Y9YSP9_9AGAM|nr:hypothetical protein EVG20_g5833 [Dentipellis fragilis]
MSEERFPEMSPSIQPSNPAEEAASEERAILRLASKLLEQIFKETTHGSSLLEDWDRPSHIVTDEARRRHQMDDLSWLYITHVCRRWRSVALKCPSLWRKMRFGHPDMVQAVIDRSDQETLAIEWDDHDGYFQDKLDADLLFTAMRHVHRVATLSICAPHKQLTSYISLLRHSVSLERLTHLRVASQALLATQPISDTLPYAPALHNFRSDKYILSWLSPVFRSNTLVELRVGIIPRTATNVEQMFTALRNLPTLELLSLNMESIYEDSWPSSDTDLPFSPSIKDLETIRLDQLCVLRFAGTMDDCAGMVDRFTLPSGAYLYLHAYQSFETRTAGPLISDHGIGEALAHHFERQGAVAHFAGVRYLCGEGFRMDVTSQYTDEYSEKGAGSGGPASLMKMMQGGGMGPLVSVMMFNGRNSLASQVTSTGQVVTGLCMALPLLDVTTVVLEIYDFGLGTDWWANMSRCMSALETVIIKDLTASGDGATLDIFLQQLAKGTGEDDPDRTSFFPTLQRLVLESNNIISLEPTYTLLVAQLLQRKKQGKDLQSLKLSEPVTDEQLVELQKYAGEVDAGQTVSK